MINQVSTTDEAKKNEFILKVNEFQKVDNIDGLLAIARLVQTLLFLKPGTYPNDPEIGIGIENYKFEWGDEKTIEMIKEKITEQVHKYIPSSSITDILVGVRASDASNTGQKNCLVIKIAFSNGRDVLISLDTLNDKGKLVSKILI